jgi:hypothetical protein
MHEPLKPLALRADGGRVVGVVAVHRKLVLGSFSSGNPE